jgi:thioredoxin-related protein
MIRIVFSTLLLFFSVSAAAEAPDGYDFISFDKAMNQAKNETKLMFVYFGRYGCGYCEKTNKESFIDDYVHERYSENYVLAYVDSESGKRLRLPSGERITERELGTRYKAALTPVFTFMTPKGKVIYQMIGVQTVEDLINADHKVQQALNKARSS